MPISCAMAGASSLPSVQENVRIHWVCGAIMRSRSRTCASDSWTWSAGLWPGQVGAEAKAVKTVFEQGDQPSDEVGPAEIEALEARLRGESAVHQLA